MAAATKRKRNGTHLHFHPLASFCWKVLIALYENDTPFEPVIVDLGEEKLACGLPQAVAAWEDSRCCRTRARDRLMPESPSSSTTSTSSLSGPRDLHPGRSGPRPRRQGSPTASTTSTCTSRCRRSSATGSGRTAARIPIGVEQARATLAAVLSDDRRGHASKQWAAGETFTLADCAAFPALFYANKVEPFAGRYEHAARYLERLTARPSVARVLSEAKPYMPMFPVLSAGED